MKRTDRWFSPRLEQEIGVARWGHFGTPVLMYPTAGGDAEEIERFLMIDVLEPLLADGKIKLYSCDSVAGAAWMSGRHSAEYCAKLQDRFDGFVVNELVPAMRMDSDNYDGPFVVCGASIGAFNALSAICRHPDVFSTAICVSGTYDLTLWLDGQWFSEFYFASPLHYLPDLGGPQLDLLRQRFILLATGEGRWEDPEESWRVARMLGAKNIPNRVDPWGPEWDHDWVTWRKMMPHYLGKV